MTVKKLNHVAIVVENIEKSLVLYEKGLGLTPTHIEFVESYNVRIAFLPIGDTKIEFIQPLGDEGALVNFLRTTGGGLHHIAMEVDDIENVIQEIPKKGIEMRDTGPQKGAHHSRVAFAKRKSFNGVIVEFVEVQ